MTKFVILNQVKETEGSYNEDSGEYEQGGSNLIPTVINLDALRAFYPRHQGKPGTRLTFTDGGGFPVNEAFDQILAAVASYQGSPITAVAGPVPAALETSTH